MARHSVFKKYPLVNQEFCKKVADGSLTDMDIADYLNDFLKSIDKHEDISITRRQVQHNRQTHEAMLAKVTERKRIERDVCSQYMAAIGNKPNSDMTQLVSIIVESSAAQIAMELDGDKPTTKELTDLMRLNQMSVKTNLMTGEIVKRAKAQAAEDAAAAMKANGVDEETIRTVERVIVKANDTHR